MKQKYLVLLGFFIFTYVLTLQSQEYIPLAVDGAQWIIRYDKIETPPTVDGLWEYSTMGDTIIENVSYCKVYKRLLVPTDELPPFEPTGDYDLHGFIRDDSVAKKVYAILIEDNNYCPPDEEFLLYDFSLQIGDTAEFCLIPSFANYIVTTITPGVFLGFNTRIFSENTEYEDYFEGMGSDFGLFEEMFAPYKMGNNKYVYHTFLYYYCREVPCNLVVSLPEIFNQETSFIVYPVPGDKVLNVILHDDLKAEEIIIMNTQGQIVRRQCLNKSDRNFKIEISDLPTGLYISSLMNQNQIIQKKKIIIH